MQRPSSAPWMAGQGGDKERGTVALVGIAGNGEDNRVPVMMVLGQDRGEDGGPEAPVILRLDMVSVRPSFGLLGCRAQPEQQLRCNLSHGTCCHVCAQLIPPCQADIPVALFARHPEDWPLPTGSAVELLWREFTIARRLQFTVCVKGVPTCAVQPTCRRATATVRAVGRANRKTAPTMHTQASAPEAGSLWSGQGAWPGAELRERVTATQPGPYAKPSPLTAFREVPGPARL